MNINEFFTDNFFAPILGFFVSALICWVIIVFSPRFHSLYMVQDTKANQAFHTRPTPRIGGLAIIASFAFILVLNVNSLDWDILVVLLAGTLVFIVGLKEDVYRDVSPKVRLVASFISGGLAILLTPVMITHLDLPGEDVFLGTAFVWILITLVWSAGTCHSLNLIDGLNGLAAGYTIISAASLFMISMQTDNFDVAFICMALGGSVLGFFVFNWPNAKIFLGDAGAYGLGHILAWIGIVLTFRNPDITPLAILLILFWPVADTLLTISRRVIAGAPVGQPDRYHLHHLMFHLCARLINDRLSSLVVNSIATFLIYPLILVPSTLGVIFWNEPGKAFLALIVLAAIFSTAYVGINRLLNSKPQCLKTTRQVAYNVISPIAERSKLSGIFIQECLAVNVLIDRSPSDNRWKLEVIADQSPGRLWRETFETDLEAWDAFMQVIDREGIQSLIGFDKRPERERFIQTRSY